MTDFYEWMAKGRTGVVDIGINDPYADPRVQHTGIGLMGQWYESGGITGGSGKTADYFNEIGHPPGWDKAAGGGANLKDVDLDRSLWNLKHGVRGQWSTGAHKYADGGWINELVYGVGATTGRPYVFGEDGPELVVPNSGTGRVGAGNGAKQPGMVSSRFPEPVTPDPGHLGERWVGTLTGNVYDNNGKVLLPGPGLKPGDVGPVGTPPGGLGSAPAAQPASTNGGSGRARDPLAPTPAAPPPPAKPTTVSSTAPAAAPASTGNAPTTQAVNELVAAVREGINTSFLRDVLGSGKGTTSTGGGGATPGTGAGGRGVVPDATQPTRQTGPQPNDPKNVPVGMISARFPEPVDPDPGHPGERWVGRQTGNVYDNNGKVLLYGPGLRPGDVGPVGTPPGGLGGAPASSGVPSGGPRPVYPWGLDPNGGPKQPWQSGIGSGAGSNGDPKPGETIRLEIYASTDDGKELAVKIASNPEGLDLITAGSVQLMNEIARRR